MEITITRDGRTNPAGFRYSVDEMPDYSRKLAACAACDAIERFLHQQGAREMLDAETKRRKEKLS